MDCTALFSVVVDTGQSVLKSALRKERNVGILARSIRALNIYDPDPDRDRDHDRDRDRSNFILLNGIT